MRGTLIPAWLKNILTVDDRVIAREFSLSDVEKAEPSGDLTTQHPAEGESVDDTEELRFRRTVPLSGRKKQDGEHSGAEDNRPSMEEGIPADLHRVHECLCAIFHLPENKDIVLREFYIGYESRRPAIAVFIDGMADKLTINTHILEPLMLLTHITDDSPTHQADDIMKALLPGNQLTLAQTWEAAKYGVLSGSTTVFVDGVEAAIVVETKGWEHRTVGVAQTETVVRGPHDAFTESFRANTGLVRAQLRSENLVTEMMTVGKLGTTDIAVMYIKGLTNPSLVEEVKRRIKGIDVDYLSDSGLMEQFVEDEPRALVPQIMSTERPDRISHMLIEGHVAVFVGHSPFVLAMPVVLWTLVQTPEDAYVRFPYGTFLRFVRWTAMFIAVFLPAFYVAVANYHPEMIPTDLMLAIAGSREQVPFPLIVELLLMELSIELIREAGVRVPSVIGPTIGIVGAIIIGQAAVQAGIVSPILVVVIATTALAAFAVPNYNLNFAVRLVRFIFMLAAAVFGFYGVGLLATILLAKLTVQRSFGVPLLAPVTPSMDASPDIVLRGPGYAMNQRPTYLQTLKDWRQQPVTRPWSSNTKPRWWRKRGSRV